MMPPPSRRNDGLFQGPFLVLCTDREGTRSFGALTRRAPEALRNLDVWLDSRDAANELPDGSLPR